MTFRQYWLALSALALSLFAPYAVYAQDAAQAASAPSAPPVPAAPVTTAPTVSGWQTGSDIPLHPAFITGTLPNGVRYAVRKNDEPKGRLSIRVHLRVGALMEEDTQQGWAHLLEHMLFRGTRSFPDGEGEKAWQRLGARPGSHSNAFTSFGSTRYVLDIGRADSGAMDQALAILADMMAYADIDKDILAKEKQIVMAERAMRTSEADSRIQTQRLRFYQPDHRAGERNLIGTTQTLNAATPKKLHKFYDRWYRPDRTTLVIVGDGDPATMIAAIEKAFGGWRASGKAGKEPKPAPVPKHPPATTIIEPYYSDNIELLWQRPARTTPTTLAQSEEDMTDTLAQMVLNARLREDIERTTQIVRAYVTEQKNSALVPSRLSLSMQMEADSKSDDASPALTQVYRVLNGAMRSVRQDEVDEQWRSLDRLYRQAIDREERAQSRDLADQLVASFDPKDILTDPRYNADMLTRLKPVLTAARISERLRTMFSPKPRIVYLSGKAPAGGTAEVEAMLAQAMVAVPPDDSDLAATSMDALVLPPPHAKITKQSQLADLSISRAELSNGVEIAMRPNDQLVNQVSLRVKIGRGVVARPPRDAGSFWSARALGLAGIGPFDRPALQRLGAGRQIIPQFYNDTDGLVITLNTTREDMADAMKMMVGAITQMRYDETSVRRFQSGLKTGYRNYLSDPAAVMNMVGQPLRYGGDTRFRSIPTLLIINRLTPDTFRSFWSEELAKGPVKLSIVGDFDPAPTLALATDVFGRLSPKPTPPPAPDTIAVRATAADGKPVSTLFHLGDPDRAMAMLVYPTVSGDEDIKAARAIQLTGYIVRQRLSEGFRAQQGGTYAASAVGATNRALPYYGAMLVSSELKPELIPAFQQAVNAIMSDLAANGPSADSFARARAPMLAEIETNRKSNAYWVQVLDDNLDDSAIVDAVRSYISGRAALTPADIQAVAKAYLAGKGDALPAQAFQIRVLPTPPKTKTAAPPPAPTTADKDDAVVE